MNPRTANFGYLAGLALLLLGATAVLLTPSGTVPLPAAVTLTGTPHPATPSAPWDAISLTWTSSPGASAYLVERKGPADADFVALTPASGTIQLLYDDTAIVLGATYSYRVKAIGISGAGPASNVVTVQAPPPATNDTEAPVVSILAPARRATVSGVVRVEATATDNVGVTRMELRDGSGALLASVAGGRLVYDWNTAGLKRNANQTLRVRAFDAKGNSATASVTVRIGR